MIVQISFLTFVESSHCC